MEELVRQVAVLDACSGPDNKSWSDSRFYTGSRRAADALVPSLRRHVDRQIKEFRGTEPSRRFRGRAWWNAGGPGGDGLAVGDKVQAPGADGAGRGKAVEDVVKEEWQVAGAWSCHRRNDVSIGRSAGCLLRCGGSHGIWRCWCGAPVRVCQTFSALF